MVINTELAVTSGDSLITGTQADYNLLFQGGGFSGFAFRCSSYPTSNQRNFRPELNATDGCSNRDYLQLNLQSSAVNRHYLQLKYVPGHRRQLAETVNSSISIADVKNLNGFDEAKVASGRVEMWRGSIRFGLLFPSLSFDGVLLALP